MDIHGTKKYDKVRCTNDSNNNWGGCEPVGKHLAVDGIYTVDTVEIHSWHTKVYLIEFPDKAFNSVHFENVESGEADG